ncbi:MAG: cold shock domain-containing protein [Pseudanabaena sp.]
MTIDFGKVERYIEDRGFGFVSHTFAKIPHKEVFFHIKVVKRTHPELAQALDRTAIIEKVYFWYEYRTSPKGQEVLAILELKQIRHKYADHVAGFIETIKTSWMNVGKPLPESLIKATSDLLMPDEVNQLATNREMLEVEKRIHQEELQKAEAARLQAIAEQRAAQERAEAARLQAIAEQKAAQEGVEEEEFRQLVEEISALRFTQSKQVSAYIVRNRLGHKYKQISGILQMELGGEVWNFNGGFPPNIYARLCDALGLGNQGSRAVPLAFTPYKDII